MTNIHPTSLPTFLIIGAMKAGTTSLHHYLSRHPQVFMSEPKELEFFSAEENWQKGLGWYASHFSLGKDAQARGESSPGYSMPHLAPLAPARIAHTLPEARLIYLVRHPIERMASHWAHRVAEGLESRPIDVALLEDPRYLETSRYATRLQEYEGHFDRERILVVTSESLRHRREATVRRVLRFLQLDESLLPANLDREFHRSDAKQELPAAVTRARGHPVAQLARKVVPLAVRRPLHRWVARPVVPPEQRRPSRQVELKLQEKLADEVRRLRDYLGQELAGWGFG